MVKQNLKAEASSGLSKSAGEQGAGLFQLVDTQH
jgi:hypothetical protein